MSSKFLAACIQLSSKRDIEANCDEIFDILDKAIEEGADFITFPECTGMMEPDHDLLRKKVPFEQNHILLPAIREKAIKGNAWILIGSLAIRLSDESIVNRSYLIDDKGNIAATYDKIHMFDVQLSKHDTYKESKRFQSGKKLKIAIKAARRDQVYTAIFQGGRDLIRQTEDLCIPLAEFLNRLDDIGKNPVVFAGNGLQRYSENIYRRLNKPVLASPTFHVPRGINIAHLGAERFQSDNIDDYLSITPNYVRSGPP